jgi:hypothetical protein
MLPIGQMLLIGKMLPIWKMLLIGQILLIGRMLLILPAPAVGAAPHDIGTKGFVFVVPFPFVSSLILLFHY